MEKEQPRTQARQRRGVCGREPREGQRAIRRVVAAQPGEAEGRLHEVARGQPRTHQGPRGGVPGGQPRRVQRSSQSLETGQQGSGCRLLPQAPRHPVAGRALMGQPGGHRGHLRSSAGAARRGRPDLPRRPHRSAHQPACLRPALRSESRADPARREPEQEQQALARHAVDRVSFQAEAPQCLQ